MTNPPPPPAPDGGSTIRSDRLYSPTRNGCLFWLFLALIAWLVVSWLWPEWGWQRFRERDDVPPTPPAAVDQSSTVSAPSLSVTV